MDEASFAGLGERLAGELTEELHGRPGKRWRCPADLRSRVISYSRVCRERGETLGDIAARLGLVESTLARWLRADRKELVAGFRSVSIVPAGDEVGGMAGGNLRLVTPRGYCVDGLDAQTLAFLLRVVG